VTIVGTSYGKEIATKVVKSCSSSCRQLAHCVKGVFLALLALISTQYGSAAWALSEKIPIVSRRAEIQSAFEAGVRDIVIREIAFPTDPNTAENAIVICLGINSGDPLQQGRAGAWWEDEKNIDAPDMLEGERAFLSSSLRVDVVRFNACNVPSNKKIFKLIIGVGPTVFGQALGSEAIANGLRGGLSIDELKREVVCISALIDQWPNGISFTAFRELDHKIQRLGSVAIGGM